MTEHTERLWSTQHYSTSSIDWTPGSVCFAVAEPYHDNWASTYAAAKQYGSGMVKIGLAKNYCVSSTADKIYVGLAYGNSHENLDTLLNFIYKIQKHEQH